MSSYIYLIDNVILIIRIIESTDINRTRSPVERLRAFPSLARVIKKIVPVSNSPGPFEAWLQSRPAIH